MEHTQEQIKELKTKAGQWDALGHEIAKRYYKTGEIIEVDGEYVDYESGSEQEGDLIQIGASAAIAFGFL